MSLRGNYKKYLSEIKTYVAQSKNPYSCPSVPRSTARYWIKNSHMHKKTVIKTSVQLLEEEVLNLNEKLKKQKVILSLVTNVRKLFPYNFSKKKVKNKDLKKELLMKLKKAKTYNKIHMVDVSTGI